MTPIQEIPGLYRIIPLKQLRRTPGVFFDYIPKEVLPKIDAIDRVIHEHGATSPGPIDDIKHPWYMHTHQADNLLVLHGTRYVDIYTPKHGKIEKFVVRPNLIEHDDKVLVDGPAMLVWPTGVFHRIKSSDTEGSASVNLAIRYEKFDIKTNFSIYDVNTETGEYRVIREGHLDQF